MTPELSRDNPRLLELEAAYRDLNLFEHSLWQTWADNIDIQNFRGEHAYLSTWYGMTEERYQNTYQYLCEIGEGETIARLGEDGAFGAVTFVAADGVTFSRDLLDSAIQLHFLERALGLTAGDPVTFLDVGSGYGRFAHRAAFLFPHSRILCTDAIPLSSFLCEFYIHYRQIEGNAFSVPLHRIAMLDLPFTGIDIATNQQSFSEMPLSAVDFWLGLCADLNIRYFFLEPHSGNLRDAHFVTSEPDGSHSNYLPLFEQHGYRMIKQEHKYPPEMALIYNTEICLFQRG